LDLKIRIQEKILRLLNSKTINPETIDQKFKVKIVCSLTSIFGFLFQFVLMVVCGIMNTEDKPRGSIHILQEKT
jgi:hypothetical protein